MALEIRQNLKLSQSLVMTPQLQQAIRLLQLSRLELVETVQQELLENPVLEETSDGEDLPAHAESSREAPSELDEFPEKKTESESQEVMQSKSGEIQEPKDFEWENYLDSYSAPERSTFEIPEDLPSYENTLSQKTNLFDHLLWQLQLSNLSPEEEEIGALMIGSINEDGYLEESLEEIAEKTKVPLEKAEAVLEKIQRFDPPGVGARDLKECLLLQLRLWGEGKEALQILVAHHLEDLEKRDYKKIAREMSLSLEQVGDLAKLIQELEPKPGRPYHESSAEYITPDAYVYKVGEEWTVVLNEDGLPKLKVSPFYQNMMRETQLKDSAKEYVQNKFRSAIWLIRSIHQRQKTLYKTVQAIVKFQRDFFESGIEALKPMILRDVAEEIEMHESTVSRVTTHKYVHTPHGIYELKFFFNNGVVSSEGDSIASEKIKNRIRQIISQESPKNPYSDQEIVAILKTHKIDLARRTVAKYRELLGILPSSKRKQLF